MKDMRIRIGGGMMFKAVDIATIIVGGWEETFFLDLVETQLLN